MRYVPAVTLIVTLLLAEGVIAQEKFDPVARAAKVLPHISPYDVLLMHSDLQRVDPEKIWAEVASWGPIGKQANLIALVAALKEIRAKLLAAKVRDVYVIACGNGDPDWPYPGILVFCVEPTGDIPAAKKTLESLKVGVVIEHERRLIFGPPILKEGVVVEKPLPAADFEAAFRLAGDTDFQAIFWNAKEESASLTIRDSPPLLTPPWFSFDDHKESVKLAVLTMNFPPKAAVAWIAKMQDGVSADDVAATIKDQPFPNPSAELQNLLLKPTKKPGELRNVLTEANGGIPALRKALVEAFGDPAGQQRRQVTRNNLMEMGIGVVNYEDNYRKRPTNIVKDGKPLLSWRVQLLPYISQQALYEQFKLDEPWDSEHNRKLIPKLPRVFKSPTASPEAIAAGKTQYLAFLGEDTVFSLPDGTKTSAVKGLPDARVWMFEADSDRAVIWTKPEDFSFNPADALAGMKELPHGGLFSAAINGYPHFIPADKLNKDSVQAAVMRGEKVE